MATTYTESKTIDAGTFTLQWTDQADGQASVNASMISWTASGPAIMLFSYSFLFKVGNNVVADVPVGESGSFAIPHNADGSCTVDISLYERIGSSTGSYSPIYTHFVRSQSLSPIDRNPISNITWNISFNESDIDYVNNTSKLNYTFSAAQNATGYYSYNRSYIVKLNGTTVKSGSFAQPTSAGGIAISAQTGSQTYTHDADGTKTVTYQVLCGSTVVKSGTVDLTQIDTSPITALTFSLSIQETYVSGAAENYSTIKWTAKAVTNAAIGAAVSRSYSIVVNGTTVKTGTFTHQTGSGVTCLNVSGTMNVTHNADGTKSVNRKFVCDGGNRINSNVNLTTINRYNSLAEYGGTITVTEPYTLTINKKIPSSTTAIYYQMGSDESTRTLLQSATSDTSVSVTLPSSILSTYMTNAMSYPSGRIYLYTYLSGSQIDAAVYPFTFACPEYTPILSLGSSNHADAYTTGSLWLKGISLVSQEYTAQSNYGATNTVVFSFGQTGGTVSSLSSPAIQVNPFTISGEATITANLTDSRGKTASATKTITISNFTAPTYNFKAYRCTSGGQQTASGEYIGFTIVGSVDYSSATSNVGTWAVSIDGSEVWTTDLNEIDFTLSPPVGPYGDAASVVFTVIDSYGQTGTVTIPISAPIIYMQFGGGTNGLGVSVGGESEDDNFEVYLPTNFHSNPTVNGSPLSGLTIDQLWSGTFTSGNTTFTDSFSDYKAFIIVGYPYDSSSARSTQVVPASSFASADTTSATYAFGMFDNDSGITYYLYHVGDAGHIKYRSRSNSAAVNKIYGVK